MTWRSPDTYHLAGNGRGTATLKFYEGRDILDPGLTDPQWEHRRWNGSQAYSDIKLFDPASRPGASRFFEDGSDLID
jgi:hypothetical protein